MGRRRRIEDEELLAIAREVFVEYGFGASTRTIARRAEVSEAILFQRFRTKLELFFTAMVPPAPDLEAILASPGVAAEGAAQLEEIALRMLDYFREITPVLLPLITHPGFDYEEFIALNPDAPLNRLVEGLRRWLAALGDDGLATSAGSATSDVAAMTLVSSLNGLALFERMGVHGGDTDERMIRDVARLIWDGLAIERRTPAIGSRPFGGEAR
jgi:AcrR family transcriptional regulator